MADKKFSEFVLKPTPLSTDEVVGFSGSDNIRIPVSSLEQTNISGTSGNTDALNSATTIVNVSAAAAPTAGQVLKATGDSAATWQAESGGAPEGDAILSTGETLGKVLRADGDGTSSWVPLSGGGDALTADPLSQFASTTSAQLATVLSDATGSGSAVFGTSPDITTPTGIVKGDVGLGNVDNTSNVTERAATATLTNKTLDAATNTLTGIQTSLTSANVTTNANLAGDVTSVGNDTTIANGAVDIGMLSAGGAPSSATFLRGDGTWAAAGGSGGGDLLASLNLSDVGNAATSRTNLGLGTAATTSALDYATATQGTTADSALQSVNVPGDINATGGTPGTTTFLRGDGAWATAGGSGTVTSVSGVSPIEVDNTTISAIPAISIDAATVLLPGSMSAADKTKLDGAAQIVDTVTGAAPIVVDSAILTAPEISIIPATPYTPAVPPAILPVPGVPGSLSSEDKTKLDASIGVGDIIGSAPIVVYTLGGQPSQVNVAVGSIQGTVAAGDDGRFDTVPISDLPAATKLDGLEQVSGVQDLDTVKMTTQQISGTPTTVARGLGRNFLQGYSDFSSTLPDFSTTTHNTMWGNDSYYLMLSGSGAGARQGQSSLVSNFFQPSARLETGITAAGYAGISNVKIGSLLIYLLSPAFLTDLDSQFSIALHEMGTAAQSFVIRSGFLDTTIAANPATTDPLNAMYFEFTGNGSASPTFKACVAITNSVTNVVKVDTGITPTSANGGGTIPPIYVLRVYYNAALQQTEFFIDSALVATILDSAVVGGAGQPATRTAFANYSMACHMLGALGNANKSAFVFRHKYTIEANPLTHY